MDIKNRMVDSSVLQALAPLHQLSPQHLQELAHKTAVETFPPGFMLFQVGESDPWSVYLLAGTLELLDANGEVTAVVVAETQPAQHPISPEQPRTVSARAQTLIHVIRIDSNYLDLLMSWDQFPDELFAQPQHPSTANSEDAWMAKMLEGEVFRKIPPANLDKLLRRMKDFNVQAGEVIVQENDDKDDYFVIKRGRCAVTRLVDGQPLQIAELGPGDAFGEEALLSGTKRSATVTMLTAGTLARLSRHNFTILVQQPVDQSCSYAEALVLLNQGAAWLDVRSPQEYAHACIPGSMNIPLFELRERVNSLDMGRTYLICCDTGKRSAAASFLMQQRGFQTRVLSNGLNHLPAKILVQIAEEPVNADISRFTRPPTDTTTVTPATTTPPTIESVIEPAIENSPAVTAESHHQTQLFAEPVPPIPPEPLVMPSTTETTGVSPAPLTAESKPLEPPATLTSPAVDSAYYQQIQREMAETKLLLIQTQSQLEQARQLKAKIEHDRQQLELQAKQASQQERSEKQALHAQLEAHNRQLQEALNLKIAAEQSRQKAEAEIQRMKQRQHTIEHEYQLTVEQNQALQEKLQQMEEPPQPHQPVITEEIELLPKPKNPSDSVLTDADTVRIKPKRKQGPGAKVAAIGLGLVGMMGVGVWLLWPTPADQPSAVPEPEPISAPPVAVQASPPVKPTADPPLLPLQSAAPAIAKTTPPVAAKPEKPAPPFILQLATQDQRHEYRVNDTMTLVITVTRPAFVHCYYQTYNNEIMKIFPNPYQPTGLVQATAPQTIPDATMPFKIQFQGAGSESIQCIAIENDSVAALPKNFNKPSFEALPVTQLYQIAEIFHQAGLKVLSTQEFIFLITNP